MERQLKPITPTELDKLKLNFSSRLDTIKGIGSRSAIKISGALKIRNRIDDLAAHYLLDSYRVNEIVSKFVYNELESAMGFIRIAAIKYKKHPRISFTATQYNRDIFFEIISHIPQVALGLNKYWRNYILKNSQLRALLPSRCITCGKLFKYKKLCQSTNAAKALHIPPTPKWMTTARVTLAPLSSSALAVKLSFTKSYSSSFNEEYFKSLGLTGWNEDWYPLEPLGGVGQVDLWVYARLPEIGTYKWNHYDFWMIQKYFNGVDYAVRRTVKMAGETSQREIPGLYIKMLRVKLVNAMVRFDSSIYLNI